MRSKIIFFCVLFVCIISCASPNYIQIPENASEIWEGVGIQFDASLQWSIRIAVVEGNYFIDYPSLGCGGELVLMEEYDQKKVFRESLKYGFFSCINGGRVTLIKTGSNSMEFNWYYSSGLHGATGTLHNIKYASDKERDESDSKKGALITGTGFVVSRSGDVVTNNHVVDECRSVNILWDGGRTTVDVLARDTRNDLALMRMRETDIASATFRGGRGIRLGAEVVAFGYPLQGVLSSQLKVTTGEVNSLAGIGDDSRFLQISAPVQPGNSGGPLLDRSGNVVGVITAKIDAIKVARYTGDIPQNVNFALKASLIRAFLDVNGVQYETKASNQKLETADIAEKAIQFTVLIECQN